MRNWFGLFVVLVLAGCVPLDTDGDAGPDAAVDAGTEDDAGSTCGDGVCQSDEGTAVCPADCERPLPDTCGNGRCDPGEFTICDCDDTWVCGDGQCEFPFENPRNCFRDCPVVVD